MFTDDKKGIVYHVSTLQKRIFKIIHEQVSKEFGIHPGQVPMLFIIEKKPGISQKEIADALNIEPGTVAVMLKRMEKSGLILRTTDERDRRVLRVHLTQKAKDALFYIKDVLANLESKILSTLQESEQEMFLKVIEKINKKLDEEFPLKEREVKC